MFREDLAMGESVMLRLKSRSLPGSWCWLWGTGSLSETVSYGPAKRRGE